MILLVEDDRDQREALAEFLSLHGHSVESAADGNKALRLMADFPTQPSVILLDLEMPGLDGWGFLSERSKKPEFTDVPVVIVSGHSDIALLAKQTGVVAVMRKPVEPQTLLRVLEHFE